MLILVTGAAGRLGKKLIQISTALGHSIRAFDLPNVSWHALQSYDDVEIVRGDITDPRAVSEACSNVDLVIHLAAVLPPQSELNKELAFRVNVKGVENIINGLIEGGRPPLIFSSSISIYGITAAEDPPVDEERSQRAHNVYSESKIQAEKLIATSGIPYVILRFAPISVTELLELPEIMPFKKDQRVEFVHVADASQAIFKASLNSRALGRTINIAGGPSWQMTGEEYITGFYDALGLDVNPRYSKNYAAIDWYDTTRGQFLDYQRTSFNDFKEKLNSVAEELGLI